MNEITTQNSTEIAVLGGLAQEAQYYAKSIANGIIQLGRVLTEAKPLVKHGEWEQWIRENAGCSVRYAQVFMQAYARFGNNAAVAQIGERGKIFKLLALPAGTEEQFLTDHDVSEMSTREVEEAVRKVREEMRIELDEERKARKKPRIAPPSLSWKLTKCRIISWTSWWKSRTPLTPSSESLRGLLMMAALPCRKLSVCAGRMPI